MTNSPTVKFYLSVWTKVVSAAGGIRVPLIGDQIGRGPRRITDESTGAAFRLRRVVLACLTLLVAMPVVAEAQFPFRRPPNLRRSQSPFDQLRQRGFDHYQKGEYAQAAKVADQVLNFESNDPIAYYLRASANIELGRLTRNTKQIRDGIADARKALELRGADNDFAYLYIPYLYGMSSLAVLENNATHAETAVKYAGPVIDRPQVSRDDKSNLLYQRAFAQEQALAVEASKFNAATATEEERAEFQKAQAKRRDAAIQDYTRSIGLNPKQLGSHINLAKAWSAAGDSNRAVSVFAAAVREFPRNTTIYNERGVFFRQQGKLDEAIADFTQAVGIQRNFAMGYINRGFCLNDKGEEEAAEADFDMAIRLNPRMAMAYNLRGAARVSLGKASSAIADFSRQLELSPKDATGYANRGFARFFNADYSEAARDFQSAIDLQPTAHHLAVWRFLAKSRAGQLDDAKAELRQSLDADSGPKGWVAQVSRFLLGETAGEDLINTAQAVADKNVSAAQQCEAQFFIGQQHMLDGEAAAAKPFFEEAVKTNVRYLSAFRGARYELGDFSKGS